MSKKANAGELKTSIYFFRIERGTNSNGYSEEKEVNIFGDSVPVKCKWVNLHGSEVFEAMQLEIKDPATITMRYSPKINETLSVYRSGDDKLFEIISIDNVQNQNKWLEIRVQRKVNAR